MAKHRKMNVAELLVSLTAQKVLAECRTSNSGHISVRSSDVRKDQDRTFSIYDPDVFERSFREWCKSVGFDVTFGWINTFTWIVHLWPAKEA